MVRVFHLFSGKPLMQMRRVHGSSGCLISGTEARFFVLNLEMMVDSLSKGYRRRVFCQPTTISWANSVFSGRLPELPCPSTTAKGHGALSVLSGQKGHVPAPSIWGRLRVSFTKHCCAEWFAMAGVNGFKPCHDQAPCFYAPNSDFQDKCRWNTRRPAVLLCKSRLRTLEPIRHISRCLFSQKLDLNSAYTSCLNR